MRPSIRSLRPQSVSVRSGSSPGRRPRRSSPRVAGRFFAWPFAPRSSATGSCMRRLVRCPPSGMCADCGRRAAGASGAEDGVEPFGQVAPIACADDALLVDHLSVPGVDDRGAQDALLARVFQVHRAVVHEHIDVELDAAGHLVVGAVQVVVRHADPGQPSLGGLPRPLRTVARDVDPVPFSVPARDGLDGVRVRLRLLDVLVAMALLDQTLELARLELRDAPAELLLVRQPDTEVLLRETVQQIPVVVQGGVDVECDPRHVSSLPYGAMPTIRASKALPATPWQASRAGDDYGAPATPDWLEIDWRPHLHQIAIA